MILMGFQWDLMGYSMGFSWDFNGGFQCFFIGRIILGDRPLGSSVLGEKPMGDFSSLDLRIHGDLPRYSLW